MKILLACQQSPHVYAIPAYGFWRTYFVQGLREAGHEVVEVPDADWARGLLPLPPREHARWRDETWSRTLATARATPGLDLFLGYLYPRQIEPAAVRTLRAAGLPAVNFFCDNVREYRRLPAEFAPFDLHWVPEQAALPLYAARGWNAVFAPMPCWVPPRFRQPQPATDEIARVTFIGRRDDLRANVLAGAARAGLPLAIHGGGWTPEPAGAARPPATWRDRLADWTDYLRRQGFAAAWRRLASRRSGGAAPAFDFGPWLYPSPSDDDYARLFVRSAVTLGINRYPDPLAPVPPAYSRLRDIEAPMLGACYLTEWAPELPSLFEPGREIEIYRDGTELAAKAAALLADAPRRAALRRAGQRRALADHTVGRTLARLAGRLGLLPPPP